MFKGEEWKHYIEPELEKSAELIKQLHGLRSEIHLSESRQRSLSSYPGEDIARIGHDKWEAECHSLAWTIDKKYRELNDLERHFDSERMERLESAKSVDDVLKIALDEMDKYGLDTMASFSIHSGGGDINENILRGERFMRFLTNQGFKVWSQIPYINKKLPMRLGGSTEFDDPKKFAGFYDPLLRSGKIQNLHMIRGWEKSVGAGIEHKIAKEAGINIVYSTDEDFRFGAKPY